jgi:hypothetical protein
MSSSCEMYDKYKKYKGKYLNLKYQLQMDNDHNSNQTGGDYNSNQTGGGLNHEECARFYNKLNMATTPDLVIDLYNEVVPTYDQTWNKVNMPDRLIKRENYHVYKQIIQNYLDKQCGKSEVTVVDLGYGNSGDGYPTNGNVSNNNPSAGYPTNENASNKSNESDGYPSSSSKSSPTAKKSWFSFLF